MKTVLCALFGHIPTEVWSGFELHPDGALTHWRHRSCERCGAPIGIPAGSPAL